LEVPLAAILSRETGLLYSRLRPLLEDSVLGQDNFMALVLLLMFESDQADSHWAPFLAMIPTTFDTPLFWEDEHLQMIEGSPLFSETLDLKRMLLRAHEREIISLKPKFPVLQGVDFSLNKFLWAVSTVWNRAYWLDKDDTMPGIVPMADMMNHSSQRGLSSSAYGMADYGFDSNSQCFLVTSCYVYVPGDEVFTSYGHKNNDALLADYGFLLTKFYDSADRFTLSVSDATYHYPLHNALASIQRICEWLKLSGLNFDDLHKSSLKVCPSNPLQLLAFCRLLQMHPDQLELFTDQNSADLLAEPPVQDADTELSALRECIRLCLLQPLVSTIQEPPTQPSSYRAQLAHSYAQWYRQSWETCLQKLRRWKDAIELCLTE